MQRRSASSRPRRPEDAQRRMALTAWPKTGPRNRRAPLTGQEPSPAIGSGSERPTPTVSGEQRPFDSGACEPRSGSGAETARTMPASREGNGRSRAERPTVAGALTRCAAMALREAQLAQTRQFMIGGSNRMANGIGRDDTLGGQLKEPDTCLSSPLPTSRP